MSPSISLCAGDSAFSWPILDRKSTRLNSSHSQISYAAFCLQKNHIASSAWAPVLLLDINDALEKWRDYFFQYRRVGRTIVNDNDLAFRIALSNDRTQRLVDLLRSVVSRNDHTHGLRRDVGTIHGWTCLSTAGARPESVFPNLSR